MKKYLLSLLLVGIGFISFCSASFNEYVASSFQVSIPGGGNYQLLASGYTCLATETTSTMYTIWDITNTTQLTYGVEAQRRLYCFDDGITFRNSAGWTSSFYVNVFYDVGGGSSSCDPQYTSEECQSEYNLVPISDLSSCQGDLSSCNSSLSGCQLNLSGCMTNLDNYSASLNTCSSNLNNCNTSLSSCLSSNCPVSSGNISWSSLFINNIQHLGAPIIDITIPEEFDWDYVSTDSEFTLDIEGYNVDTEYMNGIITTQKTLPNDIDFNNIISSIVPLFVPGIVIIFFLYFIFKFIKKIF